MGCYEPTEGCLDIKAANYDVTADGACGDCCVFPTLNIQVQHVVAFTNPDTSFNFRYATFYPNPGNPADSFVIDRARFFISDIKLVRENGEEVGVLDTLKIEAPAGNALTIEDSFARLDRDIFQARTVGTIITEGIFTGLKMTLGLDEFLLETDPGSVPSGHPLSIAGDTLNYDALAGRYIPNRLIFRQDTAAIFDSLEIRITEPQVVTLPFDSPFELAEGFDINVVLRVDYMKWFVGTDMENDPLVTIRAAVRNNLPNAISVTQISQ